MTEDLTRVYAADIVKMSENDDGTVTVYGKATGPDVDLDQQICDPTWLKSAVPSWFERWGNIREQHDSHRAVGKATEYEPVDDDHFITAHIVDPLAVAKTKAGIFSGFSVGIKGARVVKDDVAKGGRITDGRIVEVSLVDVPCNETCTLTLAKSAASGDLEPVIEEPVEKKGGPDMADVITDKADKAADPKPAEPVVDTKAIGKAVTKAVEKAVEKATPVDPDEKKAAFIADLTKALEDDETAKVVVKALGLKKIVKKALEAEKAAAEDRIKAVEARLAEVLAQPAPGGPARGVAPAVAKTPGADLVNGYLAMAESARNVGDVPLAEAYEAKAQAVAPA